MFKFVQCLFLERHPWNKNGSLNPALIWQRFTCDFKLASSMPSALSRAVKKKHGRFSSAKSNCMVRYFEKAKTSVTIEGRNKVITYTAFTCIKAATIRPATSYSGLYNKRQSGLLLCMGYWPSVRSRWLDIGQVLFWPSSRKKKNEANIQPSWPNKLGQ